MTGPFWHGGGSIEGDMILPSSQTGSSRSGEREGVFVTTNRVLAETYAATVKGPAWVYEVEPIGPITDKPPEIGGPTISYRCAQARIVRRFTLAGDRRIQIKRRVRQAAVELLTELAEQD